MACTVPMRNFVFYGSYYLAIKELPVSEQGKVYKAIIDYAMARIEPNLSGVGKAMFTLIKPTLDAQIKNYENGKKGGRPLKQTEIETQTETDQETQTETQTITQDKTQPQSDKIFEKEKEIKKVLESKKVSNGRASYDEIISENCPSPAFADIMHRFIKHCLANKLVILNDTLLETIVCLDLVYGDDEQSKVDSVKQAIEGGYFDIVEKLKLRQLRRSA